MRRSLQLYVLMFIGLLCGTLQAVANGELMERKLKEAFESGQLQGLHSVLIMRKGEIYAEAHFSGKDERWGRSLGKREFGPKSVHDLRSVTKPIVSLLYGIALAEGRVPPLDTSVLNQFPEYSDLAKDEKRLEITLEHVLSMKMGTEWNEELPYSNPENSEIAMELSDDRYRYVLDRPMVREPGDYWVYNGGAVALIAKIISDGVGMSIDEYADKKLFNPLGITDYEWVKGSDGEPSAASGLRLNIHDLAKIGQLVLDNGAYKQRQIVPSEWLSNSFIPRANLRTGLRYGYFWWLAPKSWGDPPTWVAGFGNGGQRLTIQPRGEFIIAVFAGNYNKPDGWQLPVKVIEQFLVPALKSEKY